MQRAPGAIWQRCRRRWDFWDTSLSARAYFAAVELTAMLVAGVAIIHAHPQVTSSLRLAVLVTLAVGYGVAADRVAMLRRYLQMGSRRAAWTNQTSVWTFSAALVLPLGYAVLVVLALYAHVLLRGWRHKTIRTFRVLFAVATTLIGVYAAAGVAAVSGTRGPLGSDVASNLVGLAQLAAYTGSSLAATMIGLRLLGDRSRLRDAVPSRRAFSVEVTTLLLGAVAAVLITQDLWLSPVVVVLTAVLHRSTMAHELAAAARTDAKTGLLNATAWRERASELLRDAARRGERLAILLIDLDHFKLVNDTYGHLAGDLVLQTVSDVLSGAVRGSDSAGRFGGEEFALALPHIDGPHALAIAERLRLEIARRTAAIDIPVTTSVGLASSPDDAVDLDVLLAKADVALYAAKRAGRDRVRLHGMELSAS